MADGVANAKGIAEKRSGRIEAFSLDLRDCAVELHLTGNLIAIAPSRGLCFSAQTIGSEADIKFTARGCVDCNFVACSIASGDVYSGFTIFISKIIIGFGDTFCPPERKGFVVCSAVADMPVKLRADIVNPSLSNPVKDIGIEMVVIGKACHSVTTDRIASAIAPNAKR